jgi:hypothetical protein
MVNNMNANQRRGAVSRRGTQSRPTQAFVLAAVVLGACSLNPDARLEACVDGWNEAVSSGAVLVEDVFPHAWVATQEASEWNGQYPVCWVKLVGNDGVCQDLNTDRRMTKSWTTGPDCVPDHVPFGAQRYALEDGRMVGEFDT